MNFQSIAAIFRADTTIRASHTPGLTPCRRKVFAGLVLAAAFACQLREANAQETFSLDRSVTRAVLIERFASDPKSMAVAQTRAFGSNQGLTGAELDMFVDNFRRNYDDQVSLVETGRLPISSTERAFRDVTKWALQTTINEYIPGIGGGVGILLGAAEDQLENYIASDFVDFAGAFLANNKYESVVNVERVVDYVLGSVNIRDGLIADIGIDIALDASGQIAQHPSVGNVFLNRQLITGISSTNRTLLAIADELSQLDRNDTSRMNQVKEELADILSEGFEFLGSEFSVGLAELTEQQLFQYLELRDRSLLIGEEVGRNREILTAFIEDEDARRAEQLIEKLEAEIRAEERAQVQAFLQTGAALLDWIEPGLGEQYSVIANGAIQINDAITAFRAVQSLDFGSVVSLASGVSNPALAIFNMMQATGASPEQQILDQLARLSQQIAELRKEMHDRFDAVDKKLENIFVELEAGFSLVSLQLEINLDAISRSVQIGLDSQSLLLSESAKIGDAIRDTVLVPCIQRASSLPLPDESFIDCVSFLQRNATEGISREQVEFSASFSRETLSNLLARHDGRSTDILKHVFEERSLEQVPAIIVSSPSQWITAASWYNDFLVRDPEQTRRTRIQPNIAGLLARGSAIQQFRDTVLSSLEYPNAPPQGTITTTVVRPDFAEETDDYSPLISFLARGQESLDALRAMMQSATSLYFEPLDGYYLEGLDSEFSTLPSGGDVSWALRPNAPLSEAGASAMLESLPAFMRAGVNHGLGAISIEVDYVNTSTDTRNCGFFDLEREIRSKQDNYTAHIYFDAPAKSGLSSKKLGSLSFSIGGSIISHGCGAFVPAGPKFCATAECIGAAIVAAAPARLTINPVEESVLAAEWEHHRMNVGELILAELGRPGLGSEIELENAYFAALMRFAFADLLDSDDGLYALASGSAGIPLPLDYARAIDEMIAADGRSIALSIVWSVDDWFRDELLAIRDYFRTGKLEAQAVRALASVDVEHTLAKLQNLDYLVRRLDDSDVDLSEYGPGEPVSIPGVDSSDDTDEQPGASDSDQADEQSDPTATTTPPPTTGGSGGGGGAFSVIELLLSLLIVALRARREVRSQAVRSIA